jgi:hypothetical protein
MCGAGICRVLTTLGADMSIHRCICHFDISPWQRLYGHLTSTIGATMRIVLIEKAKKALLFVDYGWLKRPARLTGKGNFCAFAKLLRLCFILDFNRVILESGLSKRD